MHAKVFWSLLKHQAFVIEKHVNVSFSFSVAILAATIAINEAITAATMLQQLLLLLPRVIY